VLDRGQLRPRYIESNICLGYQAQNATLDDAKISTRDKESKHDPEMHQTCSGNQRYFAMKLQGDV